MDKGAGVRGLDIPIGSLVPLHERTIPKPSYKRLRSSIQAVGLIEPLAVYAEGETYVILDGYLRYRACLELGIPSVPCLVLPTKEAYTPNRMVNPLTGVQEHRMLTQALGAVGEEKIAQALGIRSLQHRMKDSLLRKLHPEVVRAFDERNLPLHRCAKVLSFVKPEYQLTVLREMERAKDFNHPFARTLILRAPEDQRSDLGRRKSPWNEGKAQKEALGAKLEEAERRYEFYAGLYRQYVTDLLRLCVYVRSLITNQGIAEHLQARHPKLLARFQKILFETEGKEAT
jgi:hypothetical protein